MIVIDKELEQIGSSILNPFDINKVNNINYDLTVKSYTLESGYNQSTYTLNPGKSVFVISEEIITLPNNMVAKIILRNSRIREGLSLDAPVYQPGHKTRVYFRVTNVTEKMIELDAKEGIASIMFEKLNDDVKKPYQGAFRDEFDYIGMGKYSNSYNKQIKDVEDKLTDVKNIEKNIYGNVMSIMAIFVGIFSLVNVNIGALRSGSELGIILVINFITVGVISFLVSIVNVILDGKHQKGTIVLSLLLLVSSILLTYII